MPEWLTVLACCSGREHGAWLLSWPTINQCCCPSASAFTCWHFRVIFPSLECFCQMSPAQYCHTAQLGGGCLQRRCLAVTPFQCFLPEERTRRGAHRGHVACHDGERVCVARHQAALVQQHVERLQHIGRMRGVVVGVGEAVACFDGPQEPAAARATRSSVVQGEAWAVLQAYRRAMSTWTVLQAYRGALSSRSVLQAYRDVRSGRSVLQAYEEAQCA